MRSYGVVAANVKALEASRLLFAHSGWDSRGTVHADGLMRHPRRRWMICGDMCPLVQADRRVSSGIPDPRHLPPNEYRAVRLVIRDKVRAALAESQVARNLVDIDRAK